MIDYALILSSKYAGTQWSLDGLEYSGLTWLDEITPKPSQEDLDALWPQVDYENKYAVVSAARQVAYMKESDPIFFQYQRGEKTEQEWLDAVQAVNNANPYPVQETK